METCKALSKLCVSCISCILCCLLLIMTQFNTFLNLSCDFYFYPMIIYKYYLFSKYGGHYLVILSLLVSNIIPSWSENTLYNLSLLKFEDIWYFLVNVLWALKGCVV